MARPRNNSPQLYKKNVSGVDLCNGLDVENKLPKEGTSRVLDNIKLHKDYLETFNTSYTFRDYSANITSFLAKPLQTHIGTNIYLYLLAKFRDGSVKLIRTDFKDANDFTIISELPQYNGVPVEFTGNFIMLRVRDNIYISNNITNGTYYPYICPLQPGTAFYQVGLGNWGTGTGQIDPTGFAVNVDSAIHDDDEKNFFFTFAITYNYGGNGVKYGETTTPSRIEVNTACFIDNEEVIKYKADGTVDKRYKWQDHKIRVIRPNNVPAGAISWNVYLKSGQVESNDFSEYFLIAENLTNTYFDYKRTTKINLTRSLPSVNITSGLMCGQANVINNRIWACRIKNDDYGVVVSESVDHPFMFNKNGANYLSVGTGTGEETMYLGTFRDNTGSSQTCLLTGSRLGGGKRYNMQWLAVELSEGYSINQLIAVEQLSSIGTTSYGSVVNKGNDLVYLSHLGFMNTTTTQQLNDVLSNNSISNNIISIVQEISFDYFNFIDSYYLYDVLYWKVFDNDGNAYILAYNDIHRSWFELKPHELNRRSYIFNIEYNNKPTLCWSSGAYLYIENEDSLFSDVNNNSVLETNYFGFDTDLRRSAVLDCVILGLYDFFGYVDIEIFMTKNNGDDIVKKVRLASDNLSGGKDYHDNAENYLQYPGSVSSNTGWYEDNDLSNIIYVGDTNKDIHIFTKRFTGRKVKIRFTTNYGRYKLNDITLIHIPLEIEETFNGNHNYTNISYRS
jgi:hypothetical protein